MGWWLKETKKKCGVSWCEDERGHASAAVISAVGIDWTRSRALHLSAARVVVRLPLR